MVMNPMLNGMLSNVLFAAILFSVVMLIRRWIRNPAVLHLLLVLILVKLITPAYWQPELELFQAEAVSTVEAETKQTNALHTDSAAQSQATGRTRLSESQFQTPLRKQQQNQPESKTSTQTDETVLKRSQAENSGQPADSHWISGSVVWNSLPELSLLHLLLLV
ncbi:MAG TPA: peptidase M56, partial [Planctomycetaceae bacterium]|nr:peptidase M56 [Planctomycetaceae bacterium]